MYDYNASYLNEQATLLEEFHKIQRYLIEHPLYQIYQSSVDYVAGVNEYYINEVAVREGGTLSVGDIVLFSNVYYGVITEIDEETEMFTIAEGVSFRGAKGETGPRGGVGPRGLPGEDGRDGTNGTDGKNGLSIYLYDGVLDSATTSVNSQQVEVPPNVGRGLQVGDILFSTYETTYGAMSVVTAINNLTATVDYIGQVAGASGSGGGVTDVQINGASIVSDGVANIPYASYYVAGVVDTEQQQFKGEKGFTNGIRLYFPGNTLNYMIANMYSASQLRFTNNGASVEGIRFYNGSGSSTDAYFGIVVNKKAQTELVVYTGTKDLRYRFLDDHRTGTYKEQTLLSASSTWSTGTSGSVTLPSAGLYEVKYLNGGNNYQYNFIVNWDGTNNAVVGVVHTIPDGTAELIFTIESGGVVSAVDVDGTAQTGITISYRKIGIA